MEELKYEWVYQPKLSGFYCYALRSYVRWLCNDTWIIEDHRGEVLKGFDGKLDYFYRAIDAQLAAEKRLGIR